MPNVIDTLIQNTIGPLTNELARDFGCVVTVQRATAASETDGQPTRSYADDANWTNVNAFLLDPESVAKRRIYGLVEGSSMLCLLARKNGSLASVNTLDRIRVESGPYQGVTFNADAPAVRGVFAAVSLSEAV